MPRDMYYQWRQDNWELARTIWIEKVPELEADLGRHHETAHRVARR